MLTLMFACGDSEKNVTAPAPEKMNEANPAAELTGHGAHSTGGAHVGTVPDGAKVFFVEPANGATVNSPFTVKMGVEGMAVKPAGAIEDGTGHHHIIINADPIASGVIVPADEQHKHFGKGQTETQITLPPGEHSIQLQFANGVHLSYGKKMNTEITVYVSDGIPEAVEAVPADPVPEKSK